MAIPLEIVGMRQRKPRMLSFIVDGTGTAAIGEGKYHATLTDNGTGDYTLTLVEPAQRGIVVVGCVCATASCYAEVSGTPTSSVVRVLTKSNANAATDAVFHLTIIAFDSAEQY